MEHIAPNLRTYPALFVSVYGWVPLAGLTMAVGLVTANPASRAVIASALAVIALNVAVYLPYLPYDHWQFLRFFLPATVALIVLFAAGIGVVTTALRRTRLTAVSWLPMVASAVVVWQSSDLTRYVLDDWKGHLRISMMGRYLREVLPRHAVVIAFYHGGSVAYYTGHNVVSLESMSPSRLDALVADLERLGCYPVFVVDESLEESQFRAAFKESTYAALDWPARAEFITTVRIRYFVAADRLRFIQGERWSTDVLR